MHPVWEQLADYVDKKLSETEADQITRHLATCEQCAQEVEWLDDTTRSLRADVFVAPPRVVRMAAELAFEQRLSTKSPFAATPPLTVVPAPRKVINPPSAYWRRSLGIVAAIAAVLILWVVAVQSQSRPIVAAVASSQGHVEVQQGQEGANLFGGGALSDGTAVRTGDNGTAQLAFGDGAVEVVMLEGSNLIYQTSVVEDGAYQQVNLFTDSAGDLELNAKEGVRIHLRTGVGLLECTGCQFRFHYLEPKIVAVNMVRGVVTVTNEAGDVYDLDVGEHILDYSQPGSPQTDIPATREPTATTIAATETRLPTRAVPTATVIPSVIPPAEEHDDDNSGSGGGSHDDATSLDSRGDTGVETLISTATSIPPTSVPAPTATLAPQSATEPEQENDSGSGGAEHTDNSGSGGGNDHSDNSGSGSGNDHDDNSGSGGGGNDHNDGGGGGDHSDN